uniref:GOLD domain-containing protein n=1 Tax=Lynx canadensis TaxID=61383 RepID=A0A667GQ17_LYNCA
NPRQLCGPVTCPPTGVKLPVSIAAPSSLSSQSVTTGGSWVTGQIYFKIKGLRRNPCLPELEGPEGPHGVIAAQTHSQASVKPGSHLLLVHTHRPSPAPLPSVLTPWHKAHIPLPRGTTRDEGQDREGGAVAGGASGFRPCWSLGPALSFVPSSHFKVLKKRSEGVVRPPCLERPQVQTSFYLVPWELLPSPAPGQPPHVTSHGNQLTELSNGRRAPTEQRTCDRAVSRRALPRDATLTFIFGLCFSLSTAFYFHAGEREEKCIIEDIPSDTLLTGTFRIQQWDTRRHDFLESAPGLGMFVTVTTYNDEVLLSKLYGPQGTFYFTSHSPGEHIICLESNSTRLVSFGGSKLRIHLEIRVGQHDLDAAAAQAKDKVNEVSFKLERLIEQIEQIVKEQNYQRVSLPIRLTLSLPARNAALETKPPNCRENRLPAPRLSLSELARWGHSG